MLDSFKYTPDVTKNLVIINVLVWLAAMVLLNFGNIDLNGFLAIYYWDSPNFNPYQIVTSMFSHATSGSYAFLHIAFNMYALWMFGSMLERTWGAKRFLFYYLACGIGANLLTQAFDTATVYSIAGTLAPLNTTSGTIGSIYGIPMVGASGAVYGLLLAFGMNYPRMQLRLFFPPIALEARYFVMILAAFELYMTLSNANTGIGHVAHLSGMLIGFVILKTWYKFLR